MAGNGGSCRQCKRLGKCEGGLGAATCGRAGLEREGHEQGRGRQRRTR